MARNMIIPQWLRNDSEIQHRNLNLDTVPHPTVANLLSRLCEIGNANRILPKFHKESVLKSVREEDKNDWRDAFRESGEAENLPGRTPSADLVGLIWRLAKVGHDKDHELASWNTEVYHRLLAAVFRRSHSSRGNEFNVITSNSARPHENYLLCPQPAKMVDFCVYFQDEVKTDDEAHRALARISPTGTVNHTEYKPLKYSPIAFVVESAPHGEGLDAASLQMGTWHAAQWRFLDAMAENTNAAADGGNGGPPSELGMLPGVVAHGHRWLFVLTTRGEGGKTVLWTERQFGSTDTLIGMYQAIAGLREIAAWVRDVYRPWFRSRVLADLGKGEQHPERLYANNV